MTNYTLIQNEDITKNISDGAFRLYTFLQSMCFGEKDTCYPSQEYLSQKLRKSVRQIQRYIKELVQANLIKIKRRGSISNVYTIIGKKVLQTVDKAVNKAKKAYKDYNNKYKKDKVDSFNTYDQRNYNYNNLESMLLGQMEYNPDLLQAKK